MYQEKRINTVIIDILYCLAVVAIVYLLAKENII